MNIQKIRNLLEQKGCIIGTAFVKEHRGLTFKDSEKAMIDCDVQTSGIYRYGLILRDIQTIEPIPIKGKQGIWYCAIPKREGSPNEY